MVALIFKAKIKLLRIPQSNPIIHPHCSFHLMLLPPSNCCLLFSLQPALGKQRVSNCTTDYTERHQSPSTKKLIEGRYLLLFKSESSSFQEKLKWEGSSLQNPEESQPVQNRFSCSAGGTWPRRSRCRPRSAKGGNRSAWRTLCSQSGTRDKTKAEPTED